MENPLKNKIIFADLMVMSVLFVIILLALSMFSGDAHGADCHVRRLGLHGRAYNQQLSQVFVDRYGNLVDRRGRGVVFQAVQVGQYLRTEAVVEREIRRLAAAYAASDEKEDAEIQADPPRLSLSEKKRSAVASKCGVCHKEGHASGVVLDGSRAITRDEAFAALEKVDDGAMPPKDSPQLTERDVADIFSGLRDLTKRGSENTPSQE